jgi:HD-GYP domain-containing protein (c-di-GMP phosphodiesterase class II)
MRLIGIKTLKPDDVLGASIRTSSGRIVLSSGTVMTEKFIEKIKLMGIQKVYIKDENFEDVELLDSIDDGIRNEAYRVLKEAHVNIHKDKAVDEYSIKGVSKDLVDFVRECRQKGVSILSMEAVDDYIIEHSINVAILALFIGNHMSYNFNQLCDLAVGALIHDLGRNNSKEEDREHVQRGFDVMRKCRGLSLHSSIVCYEHHENYDGTGFPRKLKGTAISDFSRTIRVADLYDNMLHGYANHNEPVMPHQAYENILALSGSVVDPAVVEIFRDTVIFYPNGCTVLLDNGLKGVVIRQNIGSPQRPL